MIQSYRGLIECVPFLKGLSEQGDAESLNLLYKNVHPLFCHCSHPFNAVFVSCAKVPIWPGEMTPAISRLGCWCIRCLGSTTTSMIEGRMRLCEWAYRTSSALKQIFLGWSSVGFLPLSILLLLISQLLEQGTCWHLWRPRWLPSDGFIMANVSLCESYLRSRWPWKGFVQRVHVGKGKYTYVVYRCIFECWCDNRPTNQYLRCHPLLLKTSGTMTVSCLTNAQRIQQQPTQMLLRSLG